MSSEALAKEEAAHYTPPRRTAARQGLRASAILPQSAIRNPQSAIRNPHSVY
jgi:hypothetical protein